MNDVTEIWLVERHVDLINESFWHEIGRIFRHRHHTDASLIETGHLIGKRDAAQYGSRYRIRRVVESTVFDSDEGAGK